jgi:hypothetical protein
MRFKRGQVTIFIIIAILLVGATALFFTFRDSFKVAGIPASIEPVYTTFLSCLEEDVLTGIDVLESQGGYITLPDFEAGSPYMPFSSQLNFVGNEIPYWYYVSGNNLQKEQVPLRSEMETQLADFIEEKISLCRFDNYYEEGFEIKQGDGEAKVNILDGKVELSLGLNLEISRANDTALIGEHKISVKSELGNLYESARKIYEYEQSTLFLENYAVDNLRLYAPVDGVELTCSPKTWVADEVFDDVQDAVESNTLALKVKGGDYTLQSKEDEYFVIDLEVDEDVRFMNSKRWPSSFEVSPSEGNILMASPVGNQPGLGIMGFCYVPYHFVYSMKYPVLVQVSSGDEIFQFPLAVIIQGNNPREALDVSAVEIGLPELCEYKNTLVEVNTYDTRLNAIEADISYECFGTKCEIGKTSITKSLKGEFPQCVNGYVMARAEGYSDAKYLYSTTETGSVDIILDKLYEKEVKLTLDGREYNKQAIINFNSDKVSKTIIYPEQRSVDLSEGEYEIMVSIYRNSSLKIGESTKQQCMNVPQSGIGGFIGLEEEKCFEIEIPETMITNALAGGGKESYYMLESELSEGNSLEINARSLPIPKSLEQVQDNYILFEEEDLDIYFR